MQKVEYKEMILWYCPKCNHENMEDGWFHIEVPKVCGDCKEQVQLVDN